MSFTDVFGGATIYPAGQTYLSLSFAVDQTLAWPVEQAIAGDNVVSSIMDLNATVTGLNVNIPDATQVSNGIQSVFNNVGSNTITILDNAGGTIISLGSGEAWVVYLTDNSTAAGTWRTFQLGASVSVASASALAGAGLKAISSTLNQTISPTSTSVTPITWVDSDRAQLTIWTGGVGILNFPAPGTVGSDWFSMVRNSGSGNLTLTPPSGTIDSTSTLALEPGESCIIITDGTNFFTVGLGQSTTGFFDFVEISVAGSGDFTLSGVQLDRISYRFTGILTGNRNIVVPNTTQQYWVDNSTTGAFTLSVNTAAQVTPVEVIQNQRNILYCDGTDVLAAESSSFTSPLAVAQGGTAAVTAAAARTNLGVPATTLTLTAGAGLTGGGTLASDRTFAVGAGTGITVNADDVALDTSSALNVDHSAVSVIAGAGLIGGGTIEADRTFNVGAGTGITVNADDIALDTSSALNADHSAISTIAGTGLTGGGTLEADRTLNLDISGLTAIQGNAIVAADGYLVDNGGVMNRMAHSDSGFIVNTVTGTADALATADINTYIEYTNGAAVAVTLNTGVGVQGNWIVIEQAGAGQVTVSGTATLNNANGLRTKTQRSIIVLYCTATDVWTVGGDTST